MAEHDVDVEGSLITAEICTQWRRALELVEQGQEYEDVLQSFDSIFFTDSRYVVKKCRLINVSDLCCTAGLADLEGEIMLGGVINYIFQGMVVAAYGEDFSWWGLLHTGWKLWEYGMTPLNSIFQQEVRLARIGYEIGMSLKRGECECSKHGLLPTDKYLARIEQDLRREDLEMEHYGERLASHGMPAFVWEARLEEYRTRRSARLERARECLRRANRIRANGNG